MAFNGSLHRSTNYKIIRAPLRFYNFAKNRCYSIKIEGNFVWV